VASGGCWISWVSRASGISKVSRSYVVSSIRGGG
jgi:hypothetical protein